MAAWLNVCRWNMELRQCTVKKAGQFINADT